jgi:CDP-paratose 2-epimerase
MSGPVLITGGAGFIGCNLADRLASEGHPVIVYDSLARPGAERNLAWLKSRWGERITPVIADVRDEEALERAVRDAAAVFHFAAQVAVTTSLEDPLHDFSVNLMGTVRLLDLLRRRETPPPVIFASTNKVYGDLADIELEVRGEGYVPSDAHFRKSGVDETRPIDFHTPYGCSKGAADQYVLDWRRSFGVPSCVLRMSCIYGRRQMGTEDQGWVAHFAIRALEGEPVTLYGDGRQVRDILDVRDAVEAYVQAWRRIDQVQGRALNLGGGPDNAASLLQVISHIEGLTGRKVNLSHAPWRQGDQRWYVSDPRRAQRELHLGQFRPWRDGVTDLVRWLADERGIDLPGAARPAAEPAAPLHAGAA